MSRIASPASALPPLTACEIVWNPVNATSSRFSVDYATARHRFREAATRLGCETHAYPIGGHGPHGEDLTIDVAITPGSRPDRALVISSGIHGVEGFFGSAVQLAALEEWTSR